MDPQTKPSSPPPPYELHDPLRWQTAASPSSSSPRLLPYIRPRQRTPIPQEHSQAQQQQQQQDDESHGSLLLPSDHNDNGEGNRRSRRSRGGGSSVQLQVDDFEAAVAAWAEERERHAQQVLRRFTRVIAFIIVAGCSLYIGWWVVVLYARARMEMERYGPE
ncbi:hypothetical protein VTN00DRAFT_659 [Thermoascus crustaceus]|uniref:uncharacterized protein n=1 Tax=Thermoascus crustaceus TaxID=5088 RepID=UPI003744129C